MSQKSLKCLSDEELFENTKQLAATERRTTAEIIRHLQEVYIRRGHAQLGHSSLFEYCVKELKYSEGAASRRVAAVRIVREIPEVRQKIESGELNLSAVAATSCFFNRVRKKEGAPLKRLHKKKIINYIEGMSGKEIEKEFVKRFPEIKRSDKVRAINEDESELRITMDSKLLEKLEEVRDLFSHKNPSMSYAELFQEMAQFVLEKKHPLYKAKRKQAAQSRRTASPLRGEAQHKTSPLGGEAQHKNSPLQKQDRYIPSVYKQEIWMRSEGRCQYVNHKTGQICLSTKYLEVDHIKPVALGGKTELENLRLLCREHNLLMSEKNLGRKAAWKWRVG